MTPQVENCIADCLLPENEYRTKQFSGQAIHRFTLTEYAHKRIDDAREAAKFLQMYPGLGGVMAYELCIRRDGVIQQALPLDRWGWHAKGWSRTHLGIAVFGDFRHEDPTDEQWHSLVWLLARLAETIGRINFAGHSDLPNSSNDSTKVCPGPGLDMNLLRDHVIIELRRRGANALETAGIQLKEVEDAVATE